MQPSGSMFLNHEASTRAFSKFSLRFSRFVEVAFSLVFFQRHSRTLTNSHLSWENARTGRKVFPSSRGFASETAGALKPATSAWPLKSVQGGLRMQSTK